jgi:hypothetical protein
MDNPSIHEPGEAGRRIEERGCGLLFLLTYSPGPACIEEAFPKLEAILGEPYARAHEAPEAAAAKAIAPIAETDARGYFHHYGHPDRRLR